MSYNSYNRGNADSQYLERSQQITSNIFKINKNVNELSKYVSHLGTSRDNQDLRGRIARCRDTTQALIRDTNSSLKQLSNLDGGSSSEANSRRMQQDKLSKDFKQVLAKFQTQAQVALSKEREAGPTRDQNYGGNTYSNQQYDERTALIESRQREQQQHMENQIDYSSSIIADRAESIAAIEETMTEVNEIYRDLSTLVVEQGTQLDNIEANMSSADSSVTSGTEQLGIASRYQKKSRNKLCCMLLIVSIVAAVVAIIVITTENKKNN